MNLIYSKIYEKDDASMTDSQIGARKKKSVRNHPFVLNSIMSDVMSSVKKKPRNLNVMDFKQMFDAEELALCLNVFFDANVTYDKLALIYEANKTSIFTVKNTGRHKKIFLFLFLAVQFFLRRSKNFFWGGQHLLLLFYYFFAVKNNFFRGGPKLFF